MPQTNPAADDWWSLQQQQLAWKLRALAAQQQYTCSDVQGRPVINIGLIPGSNPAAYGIQFVNPATGLPVLFIGETAAGSPEVVFYDSTGTNPRLILGPQANGDYALQVTDGAGVSNEVLPAYNAAWIGAALSTTSTTPVTLANSPTVTAWLGGSGDADVTVSALIDPNGVQAGNIFLTLDGTTVNANPLVTLTSNTAAATTCSCSATVRLSSWKGSPASGQAQHIFGLKYSVASASPAASFSNVSIVVNPI